MKIAVIALLLFLLFKCSFQTQCNGFKQAQLSDYDLEKIRKIILKQHPKVVVDYDEEIGSEQCFNGMGDDDPRLVAQELFEEAGFIYQEHTVKTKDGYLLTLHRIPGNGEPVLLNHGIFGSSIDWLIPGTESLPYLLAAQGYDVWLANARGNHFSKKHVSLFQNCKEYWDFSFDEIGFYDLPASIDYILGVAGNEKLTYIGHSQGTTAFFVMASLLEEYNSKIHSMIALSPMAWMSKSQSPLLKGLTTDEVVERAFGQYQFSPNSLLTDVLPNLFCGGTGSLLCSKVPFLFCGFDRTHIEAYLIPTITYQFPAGTSSKLLIHYSQISSSGMFRRFDYNNISININKYGFLSPPDYPLDMITPTVSLVYSNNDWLSNVTDVLELQDSLSNVGDVIVVDNYSHFDYLWAKDAKVKVYDKVLVLIEKYMS